MDHWRAASRRLVAVARTVWPRRRLVMEACAQIAIVDLGLRLFPLKRQGLSDLKSGSTPAEEEAFEPSAPAEQAMARDIGWAVTRAARLFPRSAKCLAQALAARAMLRRRGIGSVMRVGVARSDAFEAHAWLRAAGLGITGYPVPPHLRVIGYLPCDGTGRS